MAMSIICHQGAFVDFFPNNYACVFAKHFPFQTHHVVEEPIIVEFSELCVERRGLISKIVEEGLFICKVNSPTSAATSKEQVGMVLQEPDCEANLHVDEQNFVQGHVRDLGCVDQLPIAVAEVWSIDHFALRAPFCFYHYLIPPNEIEGDSWDCMMRSHFPRRTTGTEWQGTRVHRLLRHLGGWTFLNKHCESTLRKLHQDKLLRN